METHIVNHPYHVNAIPRKEDQVIIYLGDSSQLLDNRIVYSFDVFSLLPFRKGSRLEIIKQVKQISSFIDSKSKVFFWGVQEGLSYRLLNDLLTRMSVFVVPDNVEFFLRFLTNKNNISPKSVMKSYCHRLLFFHISGKVVYFFGRFHFMLPPNTKITMQYGFLSNQRSISLGPDATKMDEMTTPEVIIVSQPYYKDHGIDLDKWISALLAIRKYFVDQKYKVKISYHPRDSSEFRKKISAAGFYEQTCLTPTPQVYAGIFSTLLFEKAISGENAVLCINLIRDIFSKDYLYFVDLLIESLGLDPNNEVLFLDKDIAARFMHLANR